MLSNLKASFFAQDKYLKLFGIIFKLIRLCKMAFLFNSGKKLFSTNTWYKDNCGVYFCINSRANLVIEPIVNQLPQQQEHQPSISTPTSSSTGVTITALKSQPIVTTTTSATECIGRISSTPAIPTTARVVRVLQSSRAGKKILSFYNS